MAKILSIRPQTYMVGHHRSHDNNTIEPMPMQQQAQMLEKTTTTCHDEHHRKEDDTPIYFGKIKTLHIDKTLWVTRIIN